MNIKNYTSIAMKYSKLKVIKGMCLNAACEKGGNQLFHPELQAKINKQINTELSAFYAYLALENFFRSVKIALNGFADYLRHHQREELEHANILTSLMHIRGGKVTLQPICPPRQQHWNSPTEAVKSAFDLEKITAEGLTELLHSAKEVSDFHVAHEVESKLLAEQMECLHKTEALVHKMENCSSQESLLLLDQFLKK